MHVFMDKGWEKLLLGALSGDSGLISLAGVHVHVSDGVIRLSGCDTALLVQLAGRVDAPDMSAIVTQKAWRARRTVNRGTVRIDLGALRDEETIQLSYPNTRSVFSTEIAGPIALELTSSGACTHGNIFDPRYLNLLFSGVPAGEYRFTRGETLAPVQSGGYNSVGPGVDALQLSWLLMPCLRD